LASLDGRIHVNDLASGKPQRVLEGHVDAVYSLAFSPGEGNLVSACRTAGRRPPASKTCGPVRWPRGFCPNLQVYSRNRRRRITILISSPLGPSTRRSRHD
jgi:WD40 repeat protein